MSVERYEHPDRTPELIMGPNARAKALRRLGEKLGAQLARAEGSSVDWFKDAHGPMKLRRHLRTV